MSLKNPFSRSDRPSIRARAEAILASADEELLSGKTRIGEGAARQSGAGNEFWQFRPYQSGDRPQDIDWRRSARSQSVFVRERERASSRHFSLFLPDTPSLHYSSDKAWPRKYEIAAALTLAFLLWAKRHYYSLSLNHARMNCDQIEMALNSSLPVTGESATKATDIAIFCGDFLDPVEELQSVFLKIACRHGVVFQCLDPAELDLPFKGRIQFQDMAGTNAELIEDASLITESYQQKLDSHIAAIRHAVQSRGWNYHLIRTDQNPDTAFAAALHYLGEAV